MTEKRFPDNFLWGAATSSHQIEGDNRLNDWWEWENRGRTTDPSGKACGSFTRYEEDFELASQLHHNAHRFSIEWSRVEPKDGVFDEEAIAHYKKIVTTLKSKGLEPVVTLHHFTNPLWVMESGHWAAKGISDKFTRFAERMVRELADEVTYWITFNEQNVMVFKGFLEEEWPPGKNSLSEAYRATREVALAHQKTYRAIHTYYKQKGLKEVSVGYSHHFLAGEPSNRSFWDRLVTSVRVYCNNYLFPDLIAGKKLSWASLFFGFSFAKTVDFIGVNYYFKERIRYNRGLKGWWKWIGEVNRNDETYLKNNKNELGWEICPEGLRDVCIAVHKRYRVPLMITENGICTRDERQRSDFIISHLTSLHEAIAQGVPVMGYLHWSLLDNFEWSIGYFPKFGLIDVDFQTLERRVKEGAKTYARICQNNCVSV